MSEDWNGFCIWLGLGSLVLRVREVYRPENGLNQDENLIGRLLDLLEGVAYVIMCPEFVVYLHEHPEDISDNWTGGRYSPASRQTGT